MKVKIKDLHFNPFKKEINGGKLDKEQVKKIKASIKELGLMGSIPIVQDKSKYYLVSHHHRIQALKELGYKEIEATIQNYDEDQLLYGMVMENLTQRTNNFQEVVQILKCVRNYLKKKYNKSSSKHVADWLNRQGEIMPLTQISDYILVADNLSRKLYNKVEKTHSGDSSRRTDKKTISQTQAIILATIEDQQEQEDLAEALHNSREIRVRDQGKLITQYKKADKKIKKEIRKGERDIVDIFVPTSEFDYSNRIKLTSFEKNINFTKELSMIDMKSWQNTIKKLSLVEKETLYTFLIHWCHDDLTPLIKELIKEISKDKNEKGEIVFEITTRGEPIK